MIFYFEHHKPKEQETSLATTSDLQRDKEPGNSLIIKYGQVCALSVLHQGLNCLQEGPT